MTNEDRLAEEILRRVESQLMDAIFRKFRDNFAELERQLDELRAEIRSLQENLVTEGRGYRGLD